jgi:large subunit ribosomal protein L20
MPRVKRGTKRRKRVKKILKQAKGYVGGRRRLYKSARNTLEKGLQYQYRDRRQRKRDFRRLWIIRINAAARQNDISYSKFMHGLSLAGVELDRSVLADLAVNDPNAFKELADKAKSAMSISK